MRALQVALHAFRAEHAPVEGKLFPRLESDDLVVTNLELDAALLAAEAAVRLDEPIRLDTRREPDAGHRREVRPEAFDYPQRIDRNLCHVRLRLPSVVTGIQELPPHCALRQSEQRPATFRTDLLEVPAVRKLISKSELALDGGQVADH